MHGPALPPRLRLPIAADPAVPRRTIMDGLVTLFADPAVWAALFTLVLMEVVLGIDNLIFISILSNKLPEAQRQKARRIGITLALVVRLPPPSGGRRVCGLS